MNVAYSRRNKTEMAAIELARAVRVRVKGRNRKKEEEKPWRERVRE